MMQKEEFYSHLCEELKQDTSMYPYYKLVNGSVPQQQFRKAYFMQRLEYLDQHLDLTTHPAIWDCGCGYGTTCLYLAMQGQPAYGTTLEFYADQIEKRKHFWKSYGNAELFDYEYANVFDQKIPEEQFDYIILQDTLHHIEPLEQAIQLFYKALKKGGKLILIEENGACLLKRALLFKQRGFRRIVSVYDPVLQKEVLMGNENIRSESAWRRVFAKTPFKLDENSVRYIRVLPAGAYKNLSVQEVVDREQHRWVRCGMVRKYAFFGLNMVFVK